MYSNSKFPPQKPKHHDNFQPAIARHVVRSAGNMGPTPRFGVAPPTHPNVFPHSGPHKMTHEGRGTL